jgi:hypothetical protein
MNALDQAKLALTKIKLEAVSLADAQVIALEALNLLKELSKQPDINLPYSLVVRDSEDSYDDDGDDWLEGYCKGYNDCLLEVVRLNNL